MKKKTAEGGPLEFQGKSQNFLADFSTKYGSGSLRFRKKNRFSRENPLNAPSSRASSTRCGSRCALQKTGFTIWWVHSRFSDFFRKFYGEWREFRARSAQKSPFLDHSNNFWKKNVQNKLSNESFLLFSPWFSRGSLWIFFAKNILALRFAGHFLRIRDPSLAAGAGARGRAPGLTLTRAIDFCSADTWYWGMTVTSAPNTETWLRLLHLLLHLTLRNDCDSCT